MRLSFKKHVLPAAMLLAGAVALPAQASYVCIGVSGPADNTTPYFNGDLTDAQCGITDVEAVLGFTIDESLIVGSKTNAIEDVNGDIASWLQDEAGLGTPLTVTTFTTSPARGN